MKEEKIHTYIAGFFVFVILQLLISASIFYIVTINGNNIENNGTRIHTHGVKLDEGKRFTQEMWEVEHEKLLMRLSEIEAIINKNNDTER